MKNEKQINTFTQLVQQVLSARLQQNDTLSVQKCEESLQNFIQKGMEEFSDDLLNCFMLAIFSSHTVQGNI